MSFDCSDDDFVRAGEEKEPSRDEKVFSLLFSQCDKDGSGWAVVDDLVEYIRKTLAETVPSPKKNEDVYDSDQNVHEANYNLELLKCMLDTHAVDGEINLVTYKYVIGKWVKDIRSRSPSPNTSKVSEGNEEDFVDEGNDSQNYSNHSSVTSLLQESFETSGGAEGYSNHEMDPVQMMNAMSELQQEAKRLKERNDQLLIQMESSEDNMKQLQLENKDLNVKIKNQQQNLVQLDTFKEDNAELARRLLEGEKICDDLKERIENMQHELQEYQSEISDLQNQLTSTTTEREDLYSQAQTLTNMLSQKEDQIAKLEEEKASLEACLEDQHQETETLHNRLTTTSEAVEELKQENSSLQKQIIEKQKWPSSSTPFRPTAPSLHEELANSDIANGMSPMEMMNSSMEELMDSINNPSEQNGDENNDLFDKLAQSRAKFEKKAKLMDDELSDLINTPLTIVGGDKTKSEEFLSTSEDMKDTVELSLRKVETKKKREAKRNHKLSEELKKYREENEQLRNKLNDLEKQTVADDSLDSSSCAIERVTSSTQTTGGENGSEEKSGEETIKSSVSTQTVCSDDDRQQVDSNGVPIVSLTDPTVVRSLDSAYSSLIPSPSAKVSSSVVENQEVKLVPETDSGNSSMTPTKVSTEEPTQHQMSVTGNPPSLNQAEGSGGEVGATNMPTGSTGQSPLSEGSVPVTEQVSAVPTHTETETVIPLTKEELMSTNVKGSLKPSLVNETVSMDRPGEDAASLEVGQFHSMEDVTESASTIDPGRKKSVTFKDCSEDISPSNDDQHQALLEEIAQLKEQLRKANPGTTPETLTPNINDSILRKRPKLQVASVLEDSIVTPSAQPGCLSQVLRMILATIKTSVWILLFLLLVFLLLTVLVIFNSSYARCGGRICNHSPLHMFLGQNLDYSSSGEVPI